MPLYDYKCPICNHVEEFFTKHSEFSTMHICPVCIVDCKHWVKFNTTTGELDRSSDDYKSSYVDSTEGKVKGRFVSMRRIVSTPNIHQTGYSIGDARLHRGKGR